PAANLTIPTAASPTTASPPDELQRDLTLRPGHARATTVGVTRRSKTRDNPSDRAAHEVIGPFGTRVADTILCRRSCATAQTDRTYDPQPPQPLLLKIVLADPGPSTYAVRQELALQFDMEAIVEPFAGFVEVGEHPDGPLALLGEARELAHRVAAIAVDDKGQRTALRRLGRIPGEHQKLLEALHVGVAVRRRDIDDLAIMQGALLDGLPDGVLEFLGGDRSMSDGDDQAVVMGNANVNRHGLAPSIKQRLGEIQALDVRLDQRSYPGLPILAAAPAGCSGWGAGDGSFGCRPLRTRTTPAMADGCASGRFMSSQW